MDAVPERTLVEFIRYNNWANGRILEACQELSEEQLATLVPGAYGTIREILEHIIRAEAYYVQLLTGSRPQPAFHWDDQPSLAELGVYNRQVAGALMEIAQRIKPTDKAKDEWDGEMHHYHALAVFIQIINHGVEHRTNITTILNQGLRTPPDVDGWGYLSAFSDRFDLK